jgi:SPOR domain
MADNRKSFRPRRLAFGGRLFPRGYILGTVLGLLAALAPANAQDAGLKNGAASLAAGKYDTAVRQLSATINSESASAGQAAKALYLRGIAYRKLGQPARAIADLGAALWLGLPASDRVRALVNRGLAYKAAGLSSQADAEIAQARKASSSSEVEKLIAEDGGVAVASADIAAFSTEVSPNAGYEAETSPAPRAKAEPPPAPKPSTTRTADASPSGDWNTSVSGETSAPSSGNRVSRWFGSLTDTFSSSSDSAPAPAPAAAPSQPQAETAPAPRQRTAAAPPSAASWAANTETQKVVTEGGESSGSAIGRWFSRSSDAAPAPARAPAATGGGYRVQLANSGSEAEAKALWKKVSGENGQLASAQPQIEKVEIGSFGTFYSLRIGPFADREAGLKLCNALKRNGTDCSVVSPEGP